MVKIKYPIGIQNFERLRSEDFLYIDKTQLIKKLVEEGCYYFLSRPRSFGYCQPFKHTSRGSVKC